MNRHPSWTRPIVGDLVHRRTPRDIAQMVAREKWAWPGGYHLATVLDDGGVLCHTCTRTEYRYLAASDYTDGWGVIGYVVCEDMDPDNLEYCAHCGTCLGDPPDTDTDTPDPDPRDPDQHKDKAYWDVVQRTADHLVDQMKVDPRDTMLDAITAICEASEYNTPGEARAALDTIWKIATRQADPEVAADFNPEW